jgi:polymorphic membrane protein
MWFSSWLRKQNPTQAPRGRAQLRPAAARFRPMLEALEDRWLPSQIGLMVTSLADSGSGSLRAAIETADAGSHSDKFTIGFSVSGTIDLQTALPDLDNTIAIQGPGAGSLTVERAAGASFASAIVSVGEGETASLSGLTIANGNDGGILNHGTLAVSGCNLSDNSAAGFGGGIFSDFSGTLTVSGSTFSGNTAGNGGGIYNGGTATLSNSTFSGSSAITGGGISNGGTLTVTGCNLSDNSALFGGGIYSAGTLTIGGSTLSGNSAINSFGNPSGDGGGIWNDGTLTVSNSTLTGGFAAHNGGGIANLGGTVTDTGSTVSDNFASNAGGGIFNIGYTVTVMGGTISGNHAAGGGGISNSGGVLSVSACSLSGNSADADGGAILNYGAMTVSGCSLSGNSATGFDSNGYHVAGQGGGIFNEGAATVRDSLFSGNSAGFGGAIYSAIFNGIQTLDVSGSTFQSNSASESGGALDNERGTATIKESTLSGNTAGSDGGGIFNDTFGTLAVKDSTVLNNVAALGADIYDLGVLTLADSTVGVIGP